MSTVAMFCKRKGIPEDTDYTSQDHTVIKGGLRIDILKCKAFPLDPYSYSHKRIIEIKRNFPQFLQQKVLEFLVSGNKKY